MSIIQNLTVSYLGICLRYSEIKFISLSLKVFNRNFAAGTDNLLTPALQNNSA